ncbi:RluA family pseudouridine synthase [Clostridium sp. D2Q-11]|uniref:Pseudouridine synthase n=1 Tax=Anaeromonas frigoriresistens TaxID=2683708 RepID=A0A942UVY6_9FIRM|nr:RluA family pseudouridine synthase [Anaeromonas frigoriresistens]MBS4537814.1 RluA family pseudouridine synthase [Anaeromonas frigoriresistens]
MKKIIIKRNDENQRIDRFLSKYMDKASKGFIQKMIRKKRIKLNGSRTYSEEIVKCDDEITLYLAEETINKFQSEVENIDVKIDLNIIYEDDNILLINKKEGQISHSNNEDGESIVKGVKKYLIDKGEYKPEEEKTFSPAICNRLDLNTSGVIIAAKNYNSLKVINEAIRDQKIEKYYKALVAGKIDKRDLLEGYLVKDNKTNKVMIYNKWVENSKEIKTRISPIKYNEDYTLLDIELITGRTHQIRAHLSSINHPIVGDRKYGDKETNKKFNLKSQFLIAYKITFKGLKNGLEYLNNRSFEAKIDEKYNRIEQVIF